MIAVLTSQLRFGEVVAFPAVLGIATPHEAWSELEHGLGRPVFEVPTLPPSVPGMRVFDILHHALRRAGGSLLLNNVVSALSTSGGRVSALRVRVGLREERHGADWVVLASGGFASGGVELDSDWTARETALGLPVAGVPEPGEPAIRAAGTSPRIRWRAPAWPSTTGCGPSAPTASRCSRTCSSRARRSPGAEPWKEKCGDGLSLSTGHMAAELVLAETTTTQEAIAGARSRPTTCSARC